MFSDSILTESKEWSKKAAPNIEHHNTSTVSCFIGPRYVLHFMPSPNCHLVFVPLLCCKVPAPLYLMKQAFSNGIPKSILRLRLLFSLWAVLTFIQYTYVLLQIFASFVTDFVSPKLHGKKNFKYISFPSSCSVINSPTM